MLIKYLSISTNLFNYFSQHLHFLFSRTQSYKFGETKCNKILPRTNLKTQFRGIENLE